VEPALRREHGRCVLLGERLIQDWLDCGASLSHVFMPVSWLNRPSSSNRLRQWRAAGTSTGSEFGDTIYFLLEGSLAEGIPGLGAEQAPAALALFSEAVCLNQQSHEKDWLYLDGLQDPGNLGSVLRTAAAFGIQTCIPGPGCADLWSPKVLRAAMGAHRRMDLFAVHSFDALLKCFSGPIRAADAGGQAAHASDLREPGLWVLGAEGRGLSAAVKQHPSVSLLAIPMQTQTESINAAIAQSILLYEQYRQREF